MGGYVDGHAAAVRPAFSARRIFELARCAILVLERKSGVIVSANPFAGALFGRSSGSLEGIPITSLLPEWHTRITADVCPAAGPAGDAGVFHTRGQWVGGHSFSVEVGFAGAGQEPFVVLTIRELRENEGGTADLQNLVSLLNATLESTADGLLVVGLDGRITGINANFASMWRIPRTILATHDDQAVIGMVVDQLQEPEAFLAKVRELYDRPQAESLDILEFKDGRVFERFSRPQMIADRIVGRVWSFRDITARRQAEIKADRALEDLAIRADELRKLAFTDALTGLGNRALFNDELRKATAAGTPELSLLLLDLDDFKEINDVHGHQCGDGMLIELARRIRGVVRREDIVARIGGDEFVVLLPGGSDAEAVAGRLVDLAQRPIDVGGVQLAVSLSVGIAGWGSDCSDQDGGEDLLRRADIAMYAAKSAGKNRFVRFDPGMMSKLVERAALQDNLRKAIAGDAIVPFYQIVVARTGEVCQVEALARWQHEGGIRLPSDFIPHAEATGLIRDLGTMMLTKVSADMAAWLGADAERSIAVNVSGLELRDVDYAESVLEILRTGGINPGQLVLEVTESVFLEEECGAIAQLAELRRHGVRIAVDDFGTGYSSFGRLQELPVDGVKLDKSFTHRIAGADYHSPIIISMVDMAHNLGMTVTAEGIETREQADYLNSIGCDHQQGYLYGGPQPAGNLHAATPDALEP